MRCKLGGPRFPHSINFHSTADLMFIDELYFSSQKCWMRTGVLAVVFLISLRQADSLLEHPQESFSFLFTCQHLTSVSATEVTSCFLDKAQAPQLAHRHSYVISGQQTKFIHGWKSTPLTHTFHLTSCLAQRPKMFVGILIFGNNTPGNPFLCSSESQCV